MLASGVERMHSARLFTAPDTAAVVDVGLKFLESKYHLQLLYLIVAESREQTKRVFDFTHEAG